MEHTRCQSGRKYFDKTDAAWESEGGAPRVFRQAAVIVSFLVL
jgi:hypothetical protein